MYKPRNHRSPKRFGDDPREAEFVIAEVAEDVEATREMAIQIALDCAGGVQMRRQFLKETNALALTVPSNPFHIVQDANAILTAGLSNLPQTHVRLPSPNASGEPPSVT